MLESSNNAIGNRHLGILIVDGELSFRVGLANKLREEAHLLDHVGTAIEALAQFHQQPYYVVMLEMRLQYQIDGVDLVQRLLEMRPGTALIMTAAADTVETAIAAMQAGAFDFMAKPLDWELVRQRVRRARAYSRLQIENERLKQRFAQEGAMVGLPMASLTDKLAHPHSLADAVEHCEREAILAALAACDAHRDRTAQRLGISVRTLHYKMERYQLH